MATKKQADQFIDVMRPLAQKHSKRYNYSIFPSVCIAQACVESAYGTSQKMIQANAVFGIKVGRGTTYGDFWVGGCYKSKTTEYYVGNIPSKVNDWFRAYPTIEDSVGDYFDLLNKSSRYAKALNCANPLACITGIKEGGYATSPSYVETIMKVIDSFGLDRFDMVMEGSSWANSLASAGEKSQKKSGGEELEIIDGDVASVVLDVIAGKYGNGARRRLALKRAGYNYTEIQRLVNRYLTTGKLH